MRCPQCGKKNSQVKDSRPSEDDTVVRRRRECSNCEARFTTFERVQLRELVVVKRSGKLLPFDREKLVRSISIATRKREVDIVTIETLVDVITRKLEKQSMAEISTRHIGLLVMEALKDVDDVAFVRFASVYHDFQEVEDFSDFLEELSRRAED
ncbi:MAG: transcriptional regulator NrdR [Hyphomicrobiaceae bacterium]|nr:transcriptional regulator NrdR [Hyphomicrobiaceae bacterium]